MARQRVVVPETPPLLILNASARMSYASLQHWLDENAGMRPVAVLDGGSAHALSRVVAPRPVHAVLDQPATLDLLAFVARQRFGSQVSHDAVLVLCVSDEQVASGQAPYRILGELLWSDRLVLLGPRSVQDWPGGRGLLRPRRACEVAALVVAGALSVLATLAALGAVALQEGLIRLRVL